MKDKTIHVIGAGLAGCEAAWQIARRGIGVVLHEMKPQKYSPAHKNADFAELVCSNSLRSDDYLHNAVGLMHEEMRRAGSLIMECADQTKVPAGGALAVDRDGFAALITQKIKSHPLISVRHEEIGELPGEDFGRTIIATGPLTSDKLAHAILEKTDHQALSFYDAIAPVVFKDSIDFSKAWYQSRYDKGDRLDYINCPLSKEEYYRFVDELLKAQKVEFHDFEEAQYFDGCLPVEVMAERGIETLVFGPMKPVGLTNPHSSEKPYAVVQLRQDNKEDTLRNMVGFQTKMKYGEQERIFRMIPGLEKAASGSVMFDGHDLRKAEPSKIITYKLAHVPEGRHIFPQMTVEENLEMGAYADPAGMEETMKDVYKRFPRLEERRRQRAADAGRRPRPDGKAQNDFDG